MEQVISKLRGVIGLMEYMIGTKDTILFQEEAISVIQDILRECEATIQNQLELNPEE